MPYKYTGKEYDPETKLTYYGARYYDAKLSRWISVDPPLISGAYLGKDPSKLPGMGGVFNPINLDAYQYGGMNPVKYVDADGNYVIDRMTLFNSSTPFSVRFHSKDDRGMMTFFKMALPGGSFWTHYLSQHTFISETYYDSQFSILGTASSTNLAILGSLPNATLKMSVGLQLVDWLFTWRGDVSDAAADELRKEFISSAGINKSDLTGNKKYLKGLMNNIDADIGIYKKTVQGTSKDNGLTEYAKGRKDLYKKIIPEIREYWRKNYFKENP